MCRWPLRVPTPLQSILWPILDPIFVTFGQICDFRDPNLVTFYFYELNHFFRLNEEQCLLTVNMKNCVTLKESENVRPDSSNSIENAIPL